MELASRRFDRPAPPVFPPRLYRRLVHPLLVRRAGPRAARGAAAHGGLLPLLLHARALRRPPPSAGAAGGGLLRPPARLRRARPLGAARPSSGRRRRGSYPCLRDREARGADREPLRRALAADGGPGGDRRPAPLRRGRPRLPRAGARAPARPGVAARDRRRRRRARAARRGRRRPGAARAAAQLRGAARASWRRRSGWRWSSPTPTTTRT